MTSCSNLFTLYFLCFENQKVWILMVHYHQLLEEGLYLFQKT